MINTEIYQGFNPVVEVNYLDTLGDIEIRKKVLESEVATAVQEAFLNKFEKSYNFVGGKIFDNEAKRNIEELVLRCGRTPEIEAMIKIQEGLDMGRKMMVHFSAANLEYDYPSNCVDFWWRTEHEVKWLRVVVKNDFIDLKNVYENLGGENNPENVMELLAQPVGVDGLNIGEVLEMLDLTAEINSITDVKIRESVQVLMRGFTEKFGEEIVNNPNVIFRLFSAAIAEAKRINEVEIDNQIDDEDNMWLYLNASLQMSLMQTGGCASFNSVADFGVSRYIVMNNGAMEIVKGEAPEGYKLCEHCGLYYSGDKCPICD